MSECRPTHRLQFYIDGTWVEPAVPRVVDVINPTTEAPIGSVSLGSEADVDRAVVAARAAFGSFRRWTKAERIELFESIINTYSKRTADIAELVTAEMGAPAGFARTFHAEGTIKTLTSAMETLRAYEFETRLNQALVVREPIGVCGLISPWNVPVGTLMNKVAYAFAAGCAVIVKPSEIAPLSPLILPEVMQAAGVPRGVFNLINGDGATVGQRLASHPGIDMVSITGSTRAGISVAKAAADTVKRVHQELGGKSAYIVLPDAAVEEVAKAGVQRCYVGGGQSCQAPTRMLVHVSQYKRAVLAAKQAAEEFILGDPKDPRTTMGPVAYKGQFDKIQGLIAAGIEEGATLVTGGLGRPDGLLKGYFVKPTVFADVGRRFTIAQEEIFGPVLCILPYTTEAEAIEIANDSPYGLAGWVHSGDLNHARAIARELRTGRVYLNGASPDNRVPFGGYKLSGNGREGGVFGLEEYLEIKALLGCYPGPM
jgi:aldehyde dehydrogenase (NAD+)